MSVPAFTLSVDDLRAIVREEVSRSRAPGLAEPLPEVLTREQVAKLLQVHANVVSRYVRENGLPASKIGGEWRFLRVDVIDWVSSRREKS